ncbi:hypothetical protein [Aureimonas sp. D3]|uniref:hypothetical protein n=1 Tax=Aureimonas sp. D3 TaxID=1638164 RepID=UPI000784390E|nr:hypothetical protein [Aureimonas sp. D3]
MAKSLTPAGVSPEMLHEMARRVERLTVSRRDPEAFFVERSEIADALRKEAWKAEREARETPRT